MQLVSWGVKNFRNQNILRSKKPLTSTLLIDWSWHLFTGAAHEASYWGGFDSPGKRGDPTNFEWWQVVRWNLLQPWTAMLVLIMTNSLTASTLFNAKVKSFWTSAQAVGTFIDGLLCFQNTKTLSPCISFFNSYYWQAPVLVISFVLMLCIYCMSLFGCDKYEVCIHVPHFGQI